MIYLLILSVCMLTYAIVYIILQKILKKRQDVARRIHTITKEKKEVAIVRDPEKGITLNRLFRFMDVRLLDNIANELAMAGIPLRVEESLTIWFLLAVGIPAVAFFLGTSIVVALGLFIVGFSLPIILLKLNISKRTSLFNKQLVDALSIMCNCLRTGFSFQTAIESVAKEMETPISEEFERMLRERKLGLSFEYSFEEMVKRTGNQDLILISNAVLIQKQVGGNLAEILDSISQTIKERIKIANEIKVLTATGRTSGYVIGLLPVAILVLLMIVNPSYIEEFFTTSNGRMLLLLCAILESIGFFIVNKIVTVKY